MVTVRCLGGPVGWGVLLITASAPGIIRRHDRDDARYLELGAGYPAVTRLGGGTATLIDSRWLLTAGHVAANLSPFDRAVSINGQAYAIEGVAEHPRSRRRARMQRVDLALVKLAEPVNGVTPVGVYGMGDEKGRDVVFVGPGMLGDGLTGPQRDDGRMRGATNTVADSMDRYISFVFDAPPDGTELEGISGPGDSGGPALIETDGRTWIIGVSSANDSAGAAGPCRYGSTEYYARVSTEREWITSTMAAELPEQTPRGAIVDLRAAPWPKSRPAVVAEAFFDAFARGDDGAMEAFEITYRADSALKDRPVADRVQSWRRFHAEWGTLHALKCVEEGAIGLHVLVRADHEGVWKSFRFELEPGESGKLIGISIASPVAGDPN